MEKTELTFSLKYWLLIFFQRGCYFAKFSVCRYVHNSAYIRVFNYRIRTRSKRHLQKSVVHGYSRMFAASKTVNEGFESKMQNKVSLMAVSANMRAKFCKESCAKGAINFSQAAQTASSSEYQIVYALPILTGIFIKQMFTTTWGHKVGK